MSVGVWTIIAIVILFVICTVFCAVFGADEREKEKQARSKAFNPSDHARRHKEIGDAYRKRQKSQTYQAVPMDETDIPQDDSEDYEPTWKTIDFDWGAGTRHNDLVLLPDLTDITLAGTNQPGSDAWEFIEDANPAYPGVRLDRKTGNPHDKHAIAIFSIPHYGDTEMMLGYIPRTTAKQIRNAYSDEMHLVGELRRAGFKSDYSACFISINVLGPPAGKCKKFLLKSGTD